MRSLLVSLAVLALACAVQGQEDKPELVPEKALSTSDGEPSVAELLATIQQLSDRLHNIESLGAGSFSVFSRPLALFTAAAASSSAAGVMEADAIEVASSVNAACGSDVEALCDTAAAPSSSLISQRVRTNMDAVKCLAANEGRVSDQCMAAAHAAFTYIRTHPTLRQQGTKIAVNEAFAAFTTSCGEVIQNRCGSIPAQPPVVPSSFNDAGPMDADLPARNGPFRRALRGPEDHPGHHGKHHGRFSAEEREAHLDRMASRHGLTREEMRQRMKERMAAGGGRLSDEARARIQAREEMRQHMKERMAAGGGQLSDEARTYIESQTREEMRQRMKERMGAGGGQLSDEARARIQAREEMRQHMKERMGAGGGQLSDEARTHIESQTREEMRQHMKERMGAGGGQLSDEARAQIEAREEMRQHMKERMGAGGGQLSDEARAQIEAREEDAEEEPVVVVVEDTTEDAKSTILDLKPDARRRLAHGGEGDRPHKGHPHHPPSPPRFHGEEEGDHPRHRPHHDDHGDRPHHGDHSDRPPRPHHPPPPPPPHGEEPQEEEEGGPAFINVVRRLTRVMRAFRHGRPRRLQRDFHGPDAPRPHMEPHFSWPDEGEHGHFPHHGDHHDDHAPAPAAAPVEALRTCAAAVSRAPTASSTCSAAADNYLAVDARVFNPPSWRWERPDDRFDHSFDHDRFHDFHGHHHFHHHHHDDDDDGGGFFLLLLIVLAASVCCVCRRRRLRRLHARLAREHAERANASAQTHTAAAGHGHARGRVVAAVPMPAPRAPDLPSRQPQEDAEGERDGLLSSGHAVVTGAPVQLVPAPSHVPNDSPAIYPSYNQY